MVANFAKLLELWFGTGSEPRSKSNYQADF